MKFKFLALAAAMTFALAGCGGGGDGNDSDNSGGTPPPPPPPPVVTGAGFYNGKTTEKDNNLIVTTLAFDDGSYYMLFSDGPLASGVQSLNDFVAGTGTYDSGNFTSTSARDFAGSSNQPLTVSASYTVKSSIAGKLTSTDAAQDPVGFTGTYDATYEATPSLPAIAGAFTGDLGATASDNDVTFNISTTGAVTGSTSGCNFSGTVKPKTSGNAYDMQITLGAAPCGQPGLVFSGIAFLRDNVLIALATTPDKASGLTFDGVKATPK